MAEPLLAVEDLVTVFETDEGPVRAVDGVSFEVPEGGTLAIVGESGCGKSVTSLSIMGLVPEPGRVASGRIRFEGRDLLAMSERELRALRGRRLSMIFQDPSSSLNPVYTVGAQIEETLLAHLPLSRAAARARAIELLAKVGIPAPDERARAFPHQLSGGMRQRVMIAMALACEPKLLVADEPTTALDVTIQAQILELLATLQRETGTSVILVTHDLGVVAELAREVVVMYAGKVVERAATEAIFASPRHPYTRGLLRSVPGRAVAEGRSAPSRLPTIPGVVPDLRALPRGCRFQDRCDHSVERCRESEPALTEIAPRHHVACARAGELEAQEVGVA